MMSSVGEAGAGANHCGIAAAYHSSRVDEVVDAYTQSQPEQAPQ